MGKMVTISSYFDNYPQLMLDICPILCYITRFIKTRLSYRRKGSLTGPDVVKGFLQTFLTSGPKSALHPEGTFASAFCDNQMITKATGRRSVP